ncbi:MAG: ROK family protein [Rhodospirillales bacterium]|nr:ROK family protein [Rhodospirillales bacterium]
MSRFALGVDIGGTKIAVGAVGATGAVHARRTIATDAAAGFDAGLERLTRAIDETLAEAGVDAAALAGIGLGCPGPFDEASGRIENFYTLPGWEGNDIVSPLVDRFDKPVRLVNDADAALLGEALAGGARGARVALMLTIGTGIGGAVLIDGAILRGAAGDHPEIGHLIVDPTGPECYCGSRGCLEAFAAGPALARAGAEFGYADAEAVFAAADAGAAQARAIVACSADAMETAVWSLIHTLLPEVLLIGGGIGERHFALYRASAERAIARAVLAPDGAIRVVKAALGNDAGMVGAAALMLDDA